MKIAELDEREFANSLAGVQEQLGQFNKYRNDEKPIKEIEMDLNEAVKKNGLGEHEAVAMIWQAVMGALDSNKREDLIQDQVCHNDCDEED